MPKKQITDTERLDFYFGYHRANNDSTLADMEFRVISGEKPTLQDWRNAIDKAIRKYVVMKIEVLPLKNIYKAHMKVAKHK